MFHIGRLLHLVSPTTEKAECYVLAIQWLCKPCEITFQSACPFSWRLCTVHTFFTSIWKLYCRIWAGNFSLEVMHIMFKCSYTYIHTYIHTKFRVVPSISENFHVIYSHPPTHHLVMASIETLQPKYLEDWTIGLAQPNWNSLKVYCFIFSSYC